MSDISISTINRLGQVDLRQHWIKEDLSTKRKRWRWLRRLRFSRAPNIQRVADNLVQTLKRLETCEAARREFLNSPGAQKNLALVEARLKRFQDDPRHAKVGSVFESALGIAGRVLDAPDRHESSRGIDRGEVEGLSQVDWKPLTEGERNALLRRPPELEAASLAFHEDWGAPQQRKAAARIHLKQEMLRDGYTLAEIKFVMQPRGDSPSLFDNWYADALSASRSVEEALLESYHRFFRDFHITGIQVLAGEIIRPPEIVLRDWLRPSDKVRRHFTGKDPAVEANRLYPDNKPKRRLAELRMTLLHDMLEGHFTVAEIKLLFIPFDEGGETKSQFERMVERAQARMVERAQAKGGENWETVKQEFQEESKVMSVLASARDAVVGKDAEGIRELRGELSELPFQRLLVDHYAANKDLLISSETQKQLVTRDQIERQRSSVKAILDSSSSLELELPSDVRPLFGEVVEEINGFIGDTVGEGERWQRALLLKAAAKAELTLADVKLMLRRFSMTEGTEFELIQQRARKRWRRPRISTSTFRKKAKESCQALAQVKKMALERLQEGIKEGEILRDIGERWKGQPHMAASVRAMLEA